MTKFEKMKAEIIAAIENMDIQKFYDFSCDVLEESKIDGYEGKALLTCKRCKEKYGECDMIKKDINSDKECHDRFAMYCQEEEKE